MTRRQEALRRGTLPPREAWRRARLGRKPGCRMDCGDRLVRRTEGHWEGGRSGGRGPGAGRLGLARAGRISTSESNTSRPREAPNRPGQNQRARLAVASWLCVPNRLPGAGPLRPGGVWSSRVAYSSLEANKFFRSPDWPTWRPSDE